MTYDEHYIEPISDMIESSSRGRGVNYDLEVRKKSIFSGIAGGNKKGGPTYLSSLGTIRLWKTPRLWP